MHVAAGFRRATESPASRRALPRRLLPPNPPAMPAAPLPAAMIRLVMIDGIGFGRTRGFSRQCSEETGYEGHREPRKPHQARFFAAVRIFPGPRPKKRPKGPPIAPGIGGVPAPSQAPPRLPASLREVVLMHRRSAAGRQAARGAGRFRPASSDAYSCSQGRFFGCLCVCLCVRKQTSQEKSGSGSVDKGHAAKAGDSGIHGFKNVGD